MIKKDDGAAMVISLLVLMFFVALSMNVFFIAEKKAKKAGIRVVGSKSQAVVDTGANIGMYEVRTAFRFVRGYTSSNTSDITSTQGGIRFTDANERVLPIRTGSEYIRTAVFHEYFNSYEVENGNLLTPATATNTAIGTSSSAVAKIWRRVQTNPPVLSLGGYELDTTYTEDNHAAVTGHFMTNGIEEFAVNLTTTNAIKTRMIKHLRTPAVASGKSGYSGNAINSMDFWITFESTSVLQVNGATGRWVVSSEDTGDIIVRNSK